MNALPSAPLVGRGLYPLREAARLAQLDVQTASRWARGNAYVRNGEQKTSRGVISFDLPSIAGATDLTFSEMLTLRMVKAFRRHGLSLRTIKRTAERASEDYGIKNPLVSRCFRTDGRKVFIELSENAADPAIPIPAKERRLIEVLSGQQAFHSVVEPSLFANMEWLEDGRASAWWPAGRAAGVIVDPAVLFGAPRLQGTSLPTFAVAAEFRAEGADDDAAKAVAEWHGINTEQVIQAYRFETEWFRAAA